jgi:hypothetical protein
LQLSQTSFYTAQDLTRHNDTAHRSRNLTLDSLPQRATALIASGSTLSLQSTLSSVTTASSILTIESVTSQPLVVGRIFFDAQGLCRNAKRYRANRGTFAQLTRPAAGPRPHPTWACAHCGAELSRASLPLTRPPCPAGDRVFVDAIGLLQAHRRDGDGWACIWPVRDDDACGERFAGERALLEHMRQWHVELRGEGVRRAAAVDWPADGVRTGAAECGYGVEMGGRGMREGSVNFVVPAIVRD